MAGTFSKSLIKFIIPSFVILVAITLSYQSFKLNKEEHAIREQISHYSVLISSAISNDIENLRVEKISTIIDSLQSSKNIQSIEVFNEKGLVIAKRTFANKEPIGLSEKISFYVEGGKTISIQHPIYKKKKKSLTFVVGKDKEKNLVGKITISFTSYKVMADIYSETITITLLGFLFLVAISVFIWKITQHPSMLVSKLEDIPLGQMLSFSSLLKTNSPELREFIDKIGQKISKYKSYLDQEYNVLEKKKRLLEYENESLRSTCKILTEKYKNHRTMVASIGHDLKIPVDVIQKTSELLIELSNLDHQEVEWINRVLRSSREINFLSKHLMDSSLLDSEQKKVEVDLIEFAIKCAGSARILNNKKEVLIYTDVDKDIFNYIYMNEEWVNRIINNLMSNSLKFTQSGSISLSLSSYHGESGDILRATVTDQGTGILQEEQDKIFKEFYQSNTEEYNPKGFGLGLYICKHLIEDMGGEIFIRSKENEGTQITFTIPISIHNKVSPSQARIQKQLENVDFTTGMLVTDLRLRDSHKSILDTLGLYCDYYTSIDELKDNDVIISVNLYDFSDEEIQVIKSHCKRLITFEIRTDYHSDNLRPGVDAILHKHINPYQFIKNVIKWGNDSKIENIPRIGKASPIASNSTANFLSSLSEEEKILDNVVILIVEDHLDYLQTLKELLSHDDAIVDIASNYEMAFECLSKRRYDIVLTDYTLSSGKGKTGLDIAKNISSTNQNKYTSVICCTGNRSVTRDPEASKYFGSILDKPTNRQKLIAQIMKLKTKNKGIRTI